MTDPQTRIAEHVIAWVDAPSASADIPSMPSPAELRDLAAAYLALVAAAPPPPQETHDA